MASDECVRSLGKRCEARYVIVAPRQPFPRSSISQGAVHRFGRKEGFAIRLDDCNRALELFDWNFGKPRGRILIGGVINVASRDFAPTLDPPLAKKTLAIPNHERLCRRIRNA